LNNKQIFEESEARFFIAEVILAMNYLHKHDILYRDLKPENILVCEDGHIKMADFGLAKEGVSDKNKAKSFCGSPAYLPPEMLGTRGVGKAADIYQLGAVLYELLVGLPPYYTENIKKLYENIKGANLQIPNYLSPEAKNLLKKLLHKDPKQRLGVKNKDELRKDPFFKDIDWEALESGGVKPPIILTQDEDDSDIDPFEKEYLNGSEGVKFRDQDYDDKNRNVNRLKQFTFIKGEVDDQ
jgi:serine/threonine protein kinase